MKRSYVPFYQDKESKSHIFFDYEANEFFTTPPQKQSILPYFSGFAGLVLYSSFKDISFNTGLSPLTIVFLSIVLGAILSLVSIKLIMKVTNKNLEKVKILVNPTNEEFRKYIFQGKRQFKTFIYIMIFMFFLSMTGSIILLFIMPKSVLFFFLSIAIWAVAIVCAWAIRPIKKVQVYRRLERELCV